MDYSKIEQIEVKAHKIAKCIPWSENCFGCNEALPGGLGVRAYVTEDDYVVGLCTTRPEHTGFPGVTHGGTESGYGCHDGRDDGALHEAGSSGGKPSHCWYARKNSGTSCLCRWIYAPAG